MTLPLELLKVFLTVVRSGSFARAAEQLAVTPSAVSQQVQRLEDACGMKLFDRVGRSVRLSAAGQILQPYAERINSLATDAKRALDDAGELKTGSLRVVSSATAAVYYLPRLWVAFKQEHPGVHLHVAVDNSDHVTARIVHFQDDFGVLSTDRPHQDLALHLLVEDPLVVVVPTSHPWSRRSSVALADLGGEQLILREMGSASRQLVERALAKAGVKYQVSMEIASHEVLKRTVEMGYGVAIMSAAVVAREVEQGTLCKLRIRGSSICLRLQVAYHRQRAGTPAIVAMLRLVQRFQERGIL